MWTWPRSHRPVVAERGPCCSPSTNGSVPYVTRGSGKWKGRGHEGYNSRLPSPPGEVGGLFFQLGPRVGVFEAGVVGRGWEIGWSPIRTAPGLPHPRVPQLTLIPSCRLRQNLSLRQVPGPRAGTGTAGGNSPSWSPRAPAELSLGGRTAIKVASGPPLGVGVGGVGGGDQTRQPAGWH